LLGRALFSHKLELDLTNQESVKKIIASPIEIFGISLKEEKELQIDGDFVVDYSGT